MGNAPGKALIMLRTKLCCAALAAILTLSACATPGPRAGSSSGQGGYFETCISDAGVGAVVGAGVAIIDILTKPKPKNDAERDAQTRQVTKKVIGGFVAGCVIGFARTAVGKLYAENERKKAEEIAQRDAKRRADEMKRYAAEKSRLEAQPVRSASERQRRDTALERARTDFERSMEKPVVESVGPGSTIEIRTTVPQELPDMNREGSCYERTVLGTSPSGSVRQKELVCTNKDGQQITAQVEQLPS